MRDQIDYISQSVSITIVTIFFFCVQIQRYCNRYLLSIIFGVSVFMRSWVWYFSSSVLFSEFWLLSKATDGNTWWLIGIGVNAIWILLFYNQEGARSSIAQNRYSSKVRKGPNLNIFPRESSRFSIFSEKAV